MIRNFKNTLKYHLKRHSLRKNGNFQTVFEKKNGHFLAIFGHLNGNFPEGHVRVYCILPEKAFKPPTSLSRQFYCCPNIDRLKRIYCI